MAKKLKPPINPPLEILSIQQLSHLAMTFWVGGTLTIGIVIIPLLFKILDEINAATITGQILNINAYIGIVALLLALIDLGINLKLNLLQSRKFWYALVMETVLIVNYFAIFPIIVELRTKLTDVTNRIIQHSSEFSFWHSVSSILFLLTCILGALYMLERK
jgi:hypothetical protein